jgi:hypothetical protein
MSAAGGRFGWMEAVAWSALGLLAATLVGAIFWLGSRIDGLGTSLSSRIDGQSSRIDSLTSEVSRLSSRLEEHLGRHAS